MAERQFDPRKLCLMSLDAEETDDVIRKKCEKFGPIKHFQRPANKELAFVLYGDENVAKAAKEGLTKIGIVANFARAKKIDGNNNLGAEKIDRKSVQERILPKSMTPETESEILKEEVSSPDSTVAVVKGPMVRTNGFVRPGTSIQNIDQYFGACIYCNHEAGLTCQRCGDFYCSEECQDADWLNHKRVCFPMPKLIPPKPFDYGLRRMLQVPNDVSVSAENLSVMKRNSLTIDAIDGIKKMPPKLVEKEPEPETVDVLPVKPMEPEVKSVELKTPVVSTPELETKTPNTVIRMMQTKENSICSGSGSVKSRSECRGMFLEEQLDANKPKTTTYPTISQIKVKQIKNGDVVEVTAIYDHHSLYIRSMAHNDDYLQLAKAVIQAAATAPYITAVPEKNAIVLAPFEGEYYRAVILSDDRHLDEMTVAFIDFGNSEKVQRKMLKRLPEDLLTFDRQPIRVLLKNVESDVDEDEIAKMKAYLKDLEYNEFKVKTKDSIIAAKSMVELIDMKTDKIVNKAVTKLCKKRFFEIHIKKKQVDAIGEVVLIVENRRLPEDNTITCVLQTDGCAFSQQHQDIQNYGESVKNDAPYSPRHLEMCIVQIMEEGEPTWYRAQYHQQLVDGRAQVGLIDYGINENVLENDIRVFDKTMVFDCLALTCLVKKSVAPKAEVHSKLVPFARAKAISIAPIEGTMNHIVDFDWTTIH